MMLREMNGVFPNILRNQRGATWIWLRCTSIVFFFLHVRHHKKIEEEEEDED